MIASVDQGAEEDLVEIVATVRVVTGDVMPVKAKRVVLPGNSLPPSVVGSVEVVVRRHRRHCGLCG